MTDQRWMHYKRSITNTSPLLFFLPAGRRNTGRAAVFMAVSALGSGSSFAYRNLEFLTSLRYELIRDDEDRFEIAPQLEYGVFPNTEQRGYSIRQFSRPSSPGDTAFPRSLYGHDGLLIVCAGVNSVRLGKGLTARAVRGQHGWSGRHSMNFATLRSETSELVAMHESLRVCDSRLYASAERPLRPRVLQ